MPDEEQIALNKKAFTAAREMLAGHKANLVMARHSVSRGTLDRARRVLAQAIPEVIIAIENGEATLNWGARVSVFPHQRQAELVQLLRPGHRRKTMMDPRLLRPSNGSQPVRTLPALRVPDIVGAEVVLRAIGNLEALQLRLHDSVLDPGITPDEAKALLAQLSKYGGAYRLLRRMLTTRKEGQDLDQS